MSERGRPAHYLKREVVATYGERYARGFALWKHRRKCAVLERWLRPMPDVLEVACGPGRFHEVTRGRSAPAGRRYVGVDRSLAMLESYRAAHPTAWLVVADASALPFAEASFHAVLCVRFVTHLRGDFRRRVLSELRRVASDAVMIDHRHLYNLRTLSRWLRFRVGLAHAQKLRHSYRAIEQELNDAGLQLVETRSIAWGLSARVLLRATRK
ncbi:MAG: class I SAM-dependent methyltransferase [Planctomycetota bacterium]